MLQNAISLLVERSDFFFELFIEHMSISLTAIFFATVIGLVLGIFISEKQGASKPTLSIVNLLYTIPSLALLGLLIPFTGAGATTAVIALTIYGLLPMVKNTHTGLTNIDPDIIEAAKGMGSTRWQLLFRVKLPLAFPVIFSGFRNMVTMTISLTTIAAYIGAGGLGTAIFRGISNNNMAMVLDASVLTALLAIVIDLLLGALEKRLYRNRSQKANKRMIGGLVVTIIVVVVLIAGAAIANSLEDDDDSIRVTSKSFTEQLIMGEMLEEYIEANTDLDVEFTSVSSSTTANTGMLSGDYDCYVEYTGTAWSTLLQLDGVYQEDQFDELCEYYEDEGLVWTNKLGFNNTYAIVVRSDVAEEYGIETYSDLAAVSDELVLGAEPEFYEREGDGFDDLCETYGMDFAKTVDLDSGLRYTALAAGDIDVLVMFATDGQMAEADAVMLEDDLDFFPSYQAGVVVREEVLEEHPELEDLFDDLTGTISDETMQELNYAVEVEGEDPEDVAHEFLVSEGFVEDEE